MYGNDFCKRREEELSFVELSKKERERIAYMRDLWFDDELWTGLGLHQKRIVFVFVFDILGT